MVSKVVRTNLRSLFSLQLVRATSCSLSILLLSACAAQNFQADSKLAKAAHEEAAQALSSRSAGKAEADAIQNVSPHPKSLAVQKAKLRKWTEQQDRLYAVATPLLLKNAGLCKKKVRQISGFTTRTRHSYSDEYADAAEQELGLSDRLLITNVVRGSAAENAGVRRGDIVIAIEGHDMSIGQNLEDKAVALMDGALQRKNRFALTVLRNGGNLALEVPATPACAFDIELGNAEHVGAYSDGRRSLITAGMLDYARTDAELAIVVAKEIAHNIVMQRPRPHIVNTIDQLRVFDVLAKTSSSSEKIRPYTAVMDATADRYSLYLLARAGHDIDKVLPFWKRLAGQFPATQVDSYTALHPSSAYRFSVISAVSGVVKHHVKHRLPLVPH